MSDNISIDRETPTTTAAAAADKDRTNKFWTPHRFPQCNDGSCQGGLCDKYVSTSKMLLSDYQAAPGDNYGYPDILVNVRSSPVSNESKSPPPYSSLEVLGGQASMNDMYSQYLSHDQQFRHNQDTVSPSFIDQR